MGTNFREASVANKSRRNQIASKNNLPAVRSVFRVVLRTFFGKSNRNSNLDFLLLQSFWIPQVALVTFTTFLLSNENNVLDAKTAFVSLSLFNTLYIPLTKLSSVITSTIQVSTKCCFRMSKLSSLLYFFVFFFVN